MRGGHPQYPEALIRSQGHHGIYAGNSGIRLVLLKNALVAERERIGVRGVRGRPQRRGARETWARKWGSGTVRDSGDGTDGATAGNERWLLDFGDRVGAGVQEGKAELGGKGDTCRE